MQVAGSMSYENPTLSKEYNRYIMDPNNTLVETREGGRLNQSVILKYEDGTEWILLSNNAKERFCGFLYLQKAIADSSLSNIKAAENKVAIHDRKIIYLSKYYGDKKPNFLELLDYTNELSVLTQTIGFTDTAGNANLRKQENTVYVFDTEKSSFDKAVHAKIDAFVHEHDRILSVLERSLN